MFRASARGLLGPATACLATASTARTETGQLLSWPGRTFRGAHQQALKCEGKSRALIVNAARVDFDTKMDLSKLAAVVDVRQVADSSPTPEEILKRVNNERPEVLITKEIPVPGDIISKFPPEVRMICEAGTGFNNIDLEAARAKGIVVCNCPAYSSDAVAHLVITFVLNFSCSMVQQQRALCRGQRQNFTDCLQLPHFELTGKTLGLVGGSGGIGSQVADIATALGMKVLVSSRNPKPSSNPNVEVLSLEEMIPRCDFVSIHCPLTPQTKHLFDKAMLKKMKPTAYLINTARGPVIKEDDLIEVLKANGIAGAGLDVQDVEPPPDRSPLYTMENVILTPHIGWKRLETRQRLMDIVAANVAAYKQGSPVNVVS
eukprot:TRINITY_DN14098_c0_g1_i1.p1 TRINITY_DN14098_c0_g1~~TRINITY_DN14098_c0_g1_i1.p1  ORF type:complete len:374 (+),score=65.74 TRINITY_DN14098_c0_g1_i1:64-1185(+)